jgi:ribosomal protein L22
LWVKACFVDRGPTKNRRRVRPAPQGRAYRERRHFCNVTILLSNDEKIVAADAKKGGKTIDAKPAKLAESKARKRGGAVLAPRAKRTTPKAEGSAETASDSTKSATEETTTTE